MTETNPESDMRRSSLVERDLEARVQAGHWAVGARLPSENELAKNYAVCRSTVKKVLAALNQKGLLVSRQGKGHFVLPRPERPATGAIGYTSSPEYFDHPVTAKQLAGLQTALLGTPHHLSVIFNKPPHFLGDGWTTKFDGPPREHVDVDRLDAIVTSRRLWNEPGLRKLAREIPVFCTDWFEEGHRLSHVEHDWIGGFTQAFASLAAHGHEDIALLSAGTGFGLSRDFLYSLRLYNLARPDRKERRGRILTIEDFTEEEGELCGSRLFDEPRETWPTAVLASDETLCGFLRAARAAEVSVPEELSIVTINNVQRGALPWRQLSAITIDYRREGEIMGEELLRMLADPAARGAHTRLPVSWEEGDSIATARPAAAVMATTAALT